MASILPTQIPPESVPILENGRNNHNWWLFFYNISQAVLGNSGTSAAAYSVQVDTEADALINATDALGLVQRVSNLEKQQGDIPDPVYASQTPSDSLLQDPIPRAQPAQVLTPGGSPWVYTAFQDGWLILSGGTVSAIALSRDGTTFYATGLTSGVYPMSRLDQTKVTYSGAPTATYFPR